LLSDALDFAVGVFVPPGMTQVCAGRDVGA
jgi:hypothetical protein